MLWPPLVFACLGAGLVFHQAGKMNKLNGIALLLGFIFYGVLGFLGELVNHYLYPASFRNVGDNPDQVFYLVATLFLSLPIVPILYKVSKKKKPAQAPASSTATENREP